MNRIIEIPLASGVREDVDRELLPEGVLARLENYRIEKPGRIVRREGYARLSSDLDDGGMEAAYRVPGVTNVATCGTAFARLHAQDDALWAYVEDAYTDTDAVDGDSTVLAVRRSGEWRAAPVYSAAYQDRWAAPICTAPRAVHRLGRASSAVGTVSCAAAGGYLVTAHDYYGAPGAVVWEVLDLSTGTVVSQSYVAGGSEKRPHVMACGTRLVIVYQDGQALKWLILNTASGVDFAAAETIVSDLSAADPVWDASEVDGADQIIVAYNDTTANRISVKTFDPSAGTASVASDTVADYADQTIAVHRNATREDTVLLYVQGGTPWQGYVVTWNGGLSAAYQSNASAALDITGPVSVEVVSSGPTAQAYVAVSHSTTPTGYAVTLPHVYAAVVSVTSSGGTPAFSAGTTIHRARVGAKIRSGLLWLSYHRSSSQQRQMILYPLVRGLQPSGVSTYYARSCATLQRSLHSPWEDVEGPMTAPSLYSGTWYLATCEQYNGDLTASRAAGLTGYGGVVHSYSFRGRDRACTADLGGIHVAGGALRYIDGTGEIRQPDTYPEAVASWLSVAAGGTLNGTYDYKIVYRVDGTDGTMWRSAPSATISAAPSTQKVVARVETPGSWCSFMTWAELYRQHTDRTYRYVGQAWLGTNASVTIDDTGASVSSAPILYTTGGEPESIPPPAGDVVAPWRNRLFLAADDRLYYSHAYDFADGAASGPWFAASFYVQLPERITALAPLDAALIVFTAHRIYALSAAGPDRTGSGAYTQEDLAQITSEVGCSDWRSVAVFRDGVAFRSERGIELLPRGSYAVQPLSDAVEDTLATYTETCSAVVRPDHDQIRWTVRNDTAGRVLCYDYVAQQWSVETAPAYDCATMWGGSYVVASGSEAVGDDIDVDGGAWVQGGVYTDATGEGGTANFTSLLETGTISSGGRTGWQRVRSVDLVARLKGTTAIRVDTDVDGLGTWAGSGSVSHTYSSDAIVRQCYAPPTQRCESMRVRVQDSGTTEGAELISLRLEVQPKRKPGRLAPGVRT